MIISDILETGRSQHPDKPAIVSQQLSCTFGELAQRVELIAGALAAAGVGRHHRIAVLAPNHPAVVETYLAASMIGAVVVPLNPRVTAEDIKYQADDAGVGFAVVHPGLEPLARAGGLLDRPSWFCGDDFDKLVARGQSYRGDRPSSADVLVQLYTSGTTGRPKGCLLTHRGWLSGITGLAHAAAMSSADVVWPQLPLFHVAGVHFLLASLATGATYVLDGPGDADRYWDIIRTRSVSIGALFPDPAAIVAHPDASRSSGGVRLMFSQYTTDELLQSLPDTTIVTTYGATEVGGMAVLAVGDECARRGAVLGRPLLGFVAAVLDDNDRPVPPGETGEICFRGAATTVGYWNLPDASAEVLRNGWLHTGDLGRADDDGFLFFVDRKKDMVKSGGENVYSVEVETALLTHPGVAECAVIGVPDERWGEAVKAVLVASDGMTAEELDSWCLERLAAYKRPRWYSFVDALPRNALTKVVKPELRAAHDPATSIRLADRT
jgi:acyl-CoA synthetase (AMP-forming)/AMP-acid ligase II